MEAHRLSVAKDVHRGDVIQPVERVETGSEASVVSPPIVWNVVLTESELPTSLSTVLSADAVGRP